MYESKVLNCQEEGCDTEFEFTASDQEFYAEKEFSDPKRCKPCREKKKQRYNQNEYGQV